MIAYSEVFDALKTAVPEFSYSFEDSLEPQEKSGPLLHPIFMEFLLFVEGALATENNEVVDRSLAFVERLANEGDENVDNLICVSFFEDMQSLDPTVRASIRDRLGTKSKILFTRMTHEP